MATKYDTNPLDPDFPRRARAGHDGGDTSPQADGARTRPFRDPVDGEAQTRVFNDAATNDGFPHTHQPVGFASPVESSTNRKDVRFGLPENLLIAAPYIPWYLGMVAGIVLLFLLPKSETKIRFHAAQGLAAHIGVLIVTTILGIVGRATDLAQLGNFIFVLVTTIMLFVFAIKAYRGNPIHIESVDDLTNWLEEKISPSLVKTK
jgi:uncharacterized membrane protein